MAASAAMSTTWTVIDTPRYRLREIGVERARSRKPRSRSAATARVPASRPAAAAMIGHSQLPM